MVSNTGDAEIVELPPDTADELTDEEDNRENFDGIPTDVPDPVEIFSVDDNDQNVSQSNLPATSSRRKIPGTRCPADVNKKQKCHWTKNSDTDFISFMNFNSKITRETLETELAEMDEVTIFTEVTMKNVFELMSD